VARRLIAGTALLLALLPACGGSEEAAIRTVTVAEAVAAKESAPPPPPRPRTFAVSEVVDGDTVRLANGTRVRLVQIDAPELRSAECYSRAARQELVELLPVDSRVRLERDPRLDRVDRYGRQLAYVFVGGKNLNLALVRRGAAAPWFFDGDRGRYARKLALAARQARAAGRGLWSACSATVLDPSRALETRRPAPPPPPPPPPAPVVAPPPPAPVNNCHPSYEGACLDPNASDYDCAGGSGNGPEYTGYVTVVGPDEYGLDADGDGGGCEDG
jgi:endonuclease YncB( thermonuclease family)